MSYQALYRVWRPQSFDEMVGQTMIATTLKNAVKTGQLSHAYLFTGPRGTGKTSAAKILAKAVNCQHQVDGNPCNQCEVCHAITTGQLSDVIEIDAASNNGVEEIRDLRDKVRYAPSQAAYKVYIIDEVHMLTTGAFNALLKTLEEPPSQVIFILATTEPHKIPATIISRTQRFDFQRIHMTDLVGRMQYILEHDQIRYEEEALSIIARAANGGMRDSLSLLDQALSYNAEYLTTESALQVSGSMAQQVYVQYINAVYHQQSETALRLLNEQLAKGKQSGRFIEELILFSRDVLLTLHSKTNHTLLNDAELAPLQKNVPATYYYKLIKQLNQSQQQMRFTNQPDLYLEVATIELSQPTQATAEGDTGLVALVNQLQQKIETLEQKVEHLSEKPQVVSESTGVQPDSLRNETATPRERPKHFASHYQLDVSRVYRVLNEATREHIQELKQQWQRILADLSPQQRAKFMGTDAIAAGPNLALISFENAHLCGMVQTDDTLHVLLGQLAESKVSRPIQFTFITASDWPNIRKNYTVLRNQAGGNPVEIEPKTDDLSKKPDSTQATDTVQGINDEEFVEVEENVSDDIEALNELSSSETQPEIIQKAFDLFGTEIVEIDYEN